MHTQFDVFKQVILICFHTKCSLICSKQRGAQTRWHQTKWGEQPGINKGGPRADTDPEIISYRSLDRVVTL